MRIRLSLLTGLGLLLASVALAQQAPRISGTITAGGADCSVATRCVGLQVGPGSGSAAIVASGFGSATVAVEISVDATSLTTGTWTVQPEAYNLATGVTGSTFAANGYYVVPLEGGQWVRARASAYSSGTLAIAIGATPSTVAFTPKPGIDIGDVTINNAAGASAVNIQDGGNSITVDGTVSISGAVTVTDGAGALNVIVDSGTLAATQSGTWNITNVSGTVSLPTGASTLAEQQTQTTALQLIDNLPLAQGSTTSGQSGVLTQGAVTTAAPTYTNAQTAPLSLDTTGALRVSMSGGGSNAAASATGSAVPAAAGYTGVNVGGTLRGLTGLSTGSIFPATVAIVDGSGNQVTSFGGSGGTASNYTSAFPSSGTAVGFSDGTNMQGARVVDLDTGAGTVYGLVGNLVRRASGGPAELIGSSTSANSLPVVIASDQAAVPASQSGTWNIGTVTAVTGITNALPAGSNVIGHVIADSGSTTAVTQATAANLNAQVVGAAASGASKAGNPVQIGGVFNTTQPTVTNGQAVEVQATNRGAQIVATGADTFNVTVNAALPAGSNTIGALTANQSVNVAQIGGTTTVTGGTSGTQAIGGIQAADAAISGNNPVLMGCYGASTLPTAMSANGDLTRPWCTLNGVINDTPRTVTGDAITDDSVDAMKVTNATLATATSYLTVRLSDGTSFLTPSSDQTEDGASAGGETGPMVLTVRKDVPSSGGQTSTDGDFQTVLTDAFGRVWVNCGAGCSGGTQYTHDAALTPASTVGTMAMGRAASSAPTNVSVDDAVLPWYMPSGAQVAQLSAAGTLLTATSTSLNTNITNTAIATLTVGGTAHDAPASGALPLLMGCYSNTSAPADVSTNLDAVRMWCLPNGSQVISLAAGGTLIGQTGNALDVNIKSGGGSGGTSAADGATYTASTTAGTPMMGARDDTSPGALAEDKVGIVRLSTRREMYSQIRDAAGNERGVNVTSGNALTVDGSATTQPVSGTVAATQSGTWTVQPGNTANTTAWLVTGTGGTFPVTGTFWQATQPVSIAATVTVDSELPAAAAAADGASNPTAPFAISANSVFNGTTWDRWKSAANALNSTGTGVAAAQIVGQFDDTSPTAITENQFGNIRMSANRNVYQTIRDAAGNERGVNVTAGNALLVDASATTQPVSINAGTNLIGQAAIVATATTTNAATPHFLTSAASTNATSVKAGAGNVYNFHLVNTTATLYYLRMYNLATAPTCSSATGFVKTIPIPASATGAGISVDIAVGEAYGTGIAYCLTGGGASTDNTNAATGVYINIDYK